MNSFLPVIALVSAVFSLSPAVADDDKAKLCQEAEQRFIEMGLERPKGDDVAVVLTYNYTFCPQVLTVKKGTTVHFINVDRRSNHNIWFRDAGMPEGDRFFPGENWQMTFDTPGEYPYICTPHENQGMTARLIVTP